ncbi:hypothetical protein GGF37_005734, partial [Kickxella alabastrina]
MNKDNGKPRGLRARLRQRRGRTSSEDEIKPRTGSLDLTSSALASETSLSKQPAPMHSLTAVPTNGSSAYSHCTDDGGLALGEFDTDGDEEAEAEDHQGQHQVLRHQPSGAILRSHSQEFQRPENTNRRASMASNRRVSTHSVPGFNSGRIVDVRMSDNESLVNQSGSHASYSYDEADGDFDADGELNAVYLKRNTDFHMLFRNIPINELLIDDYGCALQRDILVQGRLYLTENFVCFYSNIFGWVTNLVVAFDEIVTIEKKMTALIIPNAIQISTLHAKHFFGSFIYRDSAFNQ